MNSNSTTSPATHRMGWPAYISCLLIGGLSGAAALAHQEKPQPITAEFLLGTWQEETLTTPCEDNLQAMTFRSDGTVVAFEEVWRYRIVGPNIVELSYGKTRVRHYFHPADWDKNLMFHTAPGERISTNLKRCGTSP